MNIAIVGATGNVGRKMLEVLEQKKISIDQLFLVASPRSAGQKVNFNGKEHEIFNLETYDFSKAEITFFAAGGKISEKYADYAQKVYAEMEDVGIYGYIDHRNEKMGRKIRDAEVKKIPFILIVGEQEEANNGVSVRRHGEGDLGMQTISTFIKHFQEASKI